MKATSNTSTSNAKGRVTISGVAVITNGRVLDPDSKYNHMFDADLFNPGASNGVLAALRYFNKNGPIPAPYAYFVTAQISSMPSKLPPRSAGEDATARNVVMKGIPLYEYHLIGDIKQMLPYGPVVEPEDGSPSDEALVDPRVPPYIFASGPVEHVEASSSHVVFTISVNQYIQPLKGNAPLNVRCKIDIPAEGASGRWSFLSKPEKRRNFIQRGGFVAVEGRLANVGRENEVTILHTSVEEVTLLGRASVPVLDFGNDQSPLQGKRKRPTTDSDPVTPQRFTYSSVSASASTFAKRRKLTHQSTIEDVASNSPASSPSLEIDSEGSGDSVFGTATQRSA